MKDLTYTEIYDMLNKKIKKDWGKRCPDFVLDCPVCRVYLMLDTMRDYVIDTDFDK